MTKIKMMLPKTSLRLFGRILLILFVSVLTVSCAKKPALKQEKAALSQSPEAATDEALGTLSEEGETEVEKQLRELQGETEADKALGELRKKDREEELQRVHRAVTDDQKIPRA